MLLVRTSTFQLKIDVLQSQAINNIYSQVFYKTYTGVPTAVNITHEVLQFFVKINSLPWNVPAAFRRYHYSDVTMGAIASEITSLTIVYSTVYSDADQRKHQSSASLVFVRGIDRGPVNSPHKWPVTRKMFPFDDVIMIRYIFWTV